MWSWGETNRARSPQVLRELLSRSNRRQRTRSTTVVGNGLNVDAVGAVVDDNGILSSGYSEESSDAGEDAELHGG